MDDSHDCEGQEALVNVSKAHIVLGKRLTPAKKPHAFVASKNKVEMRKTGRLPHTAAAAAVKNVPLPVVICKRPVRLNDT